MKRTLLRAFLPMAACLLVMHSAAQAHVVCGDRVFPTTLTMDDPGVSDELSLPAIQIIPAPASQTITYGYEWDKTITEDLDVAINGDYQTQSSPGQNLNGWDNVVLTLKDQHPCVEHYEHQELAWSIGLVRLMPGSGSRQLRNAGAIASVGSTAPTFYVGKGLGQLPIGYLRPLALTGELSRQLSDSPATSPDAWTYAASLQYSMPYLQQHVKALNVPQWVTRLTPIVEVAMASPDVGPTTGTIAPGVLYDSTTWQLGAEAVLPANSATRQLQGTGFVIQFHVFLDAFYKSWFGKPLVHRNLWK
jgi:hypothetical protein